MVDLNEKFPDLKPIEHPPSLMTLNGFGLAIYGARDKDEETSTFVKTHCVTLLFFPIIALGAYRVALAGNGGWYFIGREPLSVFAKAWNALMVLTLIGGFGFFSWNATYNSPDAIANRQLAAAENLMNDGKIVEAAEAYRDIVYGTSSRGDEARRALVSMHKNATVASADLSEIAKVFEIELKMRSKTTGDSVGKSVFESGMDLVEKRGKDDLAGASAVLQVIESVVTDDQRFNDGRLPIMEKLVEQEPENMQYAGQLASVLEAKGEFERCEALLAPHSNELGVTEGARILGQIWAGQGKIDEAHRLLNPYCESRLTAFNNAEAKFRRVLELQQDQILKELERGNGPDSFYTKYERASESQQMQMVDDYLTKKLDNNRTIDEARQEYVSQTNIVPVALDLGMVKLRRAQACTDAEERRAELESAKETFTSIRSVAGDTDEYRLYMGQVNYWLGKYDEGRQLFDQLLDANNRDFKILVAVSSMVREVGRSAEAKKLVEEAYQKSTIATEKQSAAAMRASMGGDYDDRIMWLERADRNDPQVKASLKAAKGSQAYIEGDFEEAERLLRESIAVYDETPEDTSALNNSGLTCFTLYRITGEQKDFDEGLRRVEKAISMTPSDSILRFNAARLFLSAVYGDTLKDSLDLAILKNDASEEMLGYLYENAKEKKQLVERIRQHHGWKKTTDLLENVLILAPKNEDAYRELAKLHELNRDIESLTEIHRRIVAAEPEIDLTMVQKFLSGEEDEKLSKNLKTVLKILEGSLSESEPNSVTRAAIIGKLSEIRSKQGTIGTVGNLDELVDMARESWQANPSSGTRGALMHLLLGRAHQRLSKTEPAYKKHADRSQRTLHPSTTLTLAVTQGGPLSETILADDDVVEAIPLVRASLEAFPDSPSSWHWALLRDVDPELAKDIAKKIGNDKLSKLSSKISTLLSPASMALAVHVYFDHLSQGDVQAANAALKTCADYGVPLPIDVD